MSSFLFQFQCCGVESYKDWNKNEYYNCSGTVLTNTLRCSVPHSCCKKQDNINVSYFPFSSLFCTSSTNQYSSTFLMKRVSYFSFLCQFCRIGQADHKSAMILLLNKSILMWVISLFPACFVVLINKLSGSCCETKQDNINVS